MEEGLYCSSALNEFRKMLLSKSNKKTSYDTTLWNKAIKNSLARDCQLSVPDSVVYGEDAAVTFPALFKCDSFCVIRYVGYAYRQRSGSIVHTFTKDCMKNFMTLIDFFDKSEFNFPKEKIDCYFLKVLFLFLMIAANEMSSLSQYYSFCNENYTDCFGNRIISLSTCCLSPFYKVSYHLIKHKFWFVIWGTSKLYRLVL